MSDKYTAKPIDWLGDLESQFLAYLPDSSVLRKNASQYGRASATKVAESGIRPKHAVIDLYSSIPNTGFSESINLKLEAFAQIYIVQIIAKNFGANSGAIGKELLKVEAASKKLQQSFQEIEPNNQMLFTGSFIAEEFISLFHKLNSKETTRSEIEEFETNSILTRFQRFQEDLEFYSNIRENFSKTYFAKWLQYGVSGPKEHTALMTWLTCICELWVLEFKKSLTSFDNKAGGRENFLRFAEGLMEPLHPEVTLGDTIRNAFEKLRSKGSLDYLYQNST